MWCQHKRKTLFCCCFVLQCILRLPIPCLLLFILVCVCIWCRCAHMHITYMGEVRGKAEMGCPLSLCLIALRQSLSPNWKARLLAVLTGQWALRSHLFLLPCADNTEGVAAEPPCLFQGPCLVSSDLAATGQLKDVMEQLVFQECPGSDISVAAQTKLASILVTPHPKNPAIISWFYLMVALFKDYWGNLPSMPDYMLWRQANWKALPNLAWV